MQDSKKPERAKIIAGQINKAKKVAAGNVGKPGMTSGNTKLSNTVNKILASRTGEDCIMGSDDNDEEKEGEADSEAASFNRLLYLEQSRSI